MGARFVIGRAGTGKTRRCFRAIVEALREDPLGPPIYWLLPKQATFVAERELTCGSGLGGFCRARVLSFDELGREVLAECGGGAVPEVTQLGRQMILGHLLRKHAGKLRFFDKVAHLPGLAVKLEATLEELECCGKDVQQLEALVDELCKAEDEDPLRDKLHDLCLIYKAYVDYLGQERLDPRRRMEQVLGCIGRSQRLRGATIYVDGFSEFDEFERRMLARLGKTCGEMEITLLMDGESPVLRSIERPADAMSLFHRMEELYRRLMKTFADEQVVVERPVVLREVHRFQSAGLGAIEREMFGEEATKRRSDEATKGEEEEPTVEMVEAPNRRAEVEHAARHIRGLLAGGMRMRDIAVLVRKLEDYHDLINAAFGEHDIRHFVDRRRTMAHHPLLQFVRAAIQIAQNDWPHEAVMMLIKSGLAGLDADEADGLENYVLEHRLRGAVWAREEAWAWHRKLTRRGQEDGEVSVANESARMDGLRRRVSEGLKPFVQMCKSGELAVRGIVVGMFELFKRFGVQETLGKWIAENRSRQEHEQASEHEQAWGAMVELLDQVVDLLGQEAVTLVHFQDILESALETFDLALTPPTVDEVLVGQVDRTRTPSAKAVLVLGLNEGVFPYAVRDSSVLSDSERMELQRHQFDVDPGTERRLLDENLLGYVAMTRASEQLYVSRSMSDDAGRPMGASVFWRRLREMFPALVPRVLPRDERADATLVSTPRQLMTALMRWARTGTGEGDVWPALYQWLASHPTEDDPIDRLRCRTWKALTYDNTAWLTKGSAEVLFPRPLSASVGQIETFASCPFRHFVRYGLSLEEREEEETVSIDLDQVFHRILENLVRQMLNRRADWESLSPQQAGELVRQYVQDVSQTLRGEMMLSSARNRYLLGRIERAMEQVIASQKAVKKRGMFRTACGGVEFGPEGPAWPPLVVGTPGKNEVHVRGRIDRVDVLEDPPAFAVLDYRLHGGELSLWQVYHGMSLHLLVYLAVMQSNGQRLAGKELNPAAAFYVRLLRQLEKVEHPADAPDPSAPAFALRGKQRGIFDGAYLPAIDNEPDCTNSKVVAARLKKDGTFGFKNNTDVADAQEMAALLKHACKQVARLGDQILEGRIDISPYRMATKTPCSSCDYRSVCRFDPAINRYHHIRPMKREQVLQIVVEECGREE